MSNVAPASDQYRSERDISDSSQLSKIIEENINLVIILAKIKLFQKILVNWLSANELESVLVALSTTYFIGYNIVVSLFKYVRMFCRKELHSNSLEVHIKDKFR